LPFDVTLLPPALPLDAQVTRRRELCRTVAARIRRTRSVTRHEIVHALAPDEASQCQCSCADEQKTSRCLNQLAQLCERHLQKFLDMDEPTLEKVASTAKSMREQYTLEAQYGAIKDRANQAWDAKDWQTARELYEKAKPGLSDAEERRLDFLLKEL